MIRGAPGRTGTLAQHYIDQFAVAPNGDFEIVAAGARPAGHTGNFMALPEGTAQIAVRETFTDRKTQRPARLAIERLGAAAPSPRAEPDVVAEQLRAMSRYLLVIAHTCALLWKSSAANTNRIVGVAGAQHVKKQDNEVNTHSDTDMVYMGGRFSLEAGQALRITLHKPPYPFVYWGLVLVNPWMESYDFRYATTHLSNGTAAPGRERRLDAGGGARESGPRRPQLARRRRPARGLHAAALGARRRRAAAADVRGGAAGVTSRLGAPRRQRSRAPAGCASTGRRPRGRRRASHRASRTRWASSSRRHVERAAALVEHPLRVVDPIEPRVDHALLEQLLDVHHRLRVLRGHVLLELAFDRRVASIGPGTNGSRPCRPR